MSLGESARKGALGVRNITADMQNQCSVLGIYEIKS